MSISERIRKVRGERSLKEFAALLDVHANTIGNYEKGRDPDARFLIKLFEIFRINSLWLLTGEGCMHVPERGIKDARTALVHEWQSFHHHHAMNEQDISEQITRSAFVRAYNEKRNDQSFDYEDLPSWIKALIPRIEQNELEDWVATKTESKHHDTVQAKQLDTLGFHPRLVLIIVEAMRERLGAEYEILDPLKKAIILNQTYKKLCELGASENNLPAQEHVRALIELIASLSGGQY